jgi:anti-sigma factor RsiW
MSTASRMVIDDCTRFSAWVAPYVDGELDPGHAVEMEAHVVGCPTCAERVALLRAMRVSLRRTAVRHAPEALCARVRATIEQERERVSSNPSAGDRQSRWEGAASARSPVGEGGEHKLMRLRYAVGLAAAAGVLFSMSMSRYFQPRAMAGTLGEVPGGELAGATDTASTRMSIDGLLDELLALHARPFPPDTTDPEQLARFDPLLGVQVRRPAFKPLGASFDGARVHAVSDRGALLQVQYTVPGGKRVTMYVFNPRVLPVQATRLEPRMVRHRPMLVGRLRGYSVAALEQSGVGYAFASDLDADESTKMVLAALPPQQ